jgi:hypothetical protein
MQDTLFLAPTVQLQHATFAKYRHWHSTMPLDYASYQVDLGQLEKRSRLSNEGEPYFGPRCVTSVLQSIHFSR